MMVDRRNANVRDADCFHCRTVADFDGLFLPELQNYYPKQPAKQES